MNINNTEQRVDLKAVNCALYKATFQVLSSVQTTVSSYISK